MGSQLLNHPGLGASSQTVSQSRASSAPGGKVDTESALVGLRWLAFLTPLVPGAWRPGHAQPAFCSVTSCHVPVCSAWPSTWGNQGYTNSRCLSL